MLAPHDQELLTAYVDGELTARQRRHVARLLRRSGEARVLLRQLQEDARQLRLLPSATLQVDLSGPILETISRRRLQPMRRPPRVAAASVAAFPAWTGFAAAAAVLLLVGVGSFLHYSRSFNSSGSGTAKRQENPDKGSVVPPIDNGLAKDERNQDLPRAKAGSQEHSQEEPVPETPGKAKNPDKDNEPLVAPPRTKTNPDLPDAPILASGEKEAAGKFEIVKVALPVLFKLHELDQAEAAGKLRDKLSSASAFRIELLCKDATRAVARLRSAFAAHKVALVIDAAAQARLKKPLWRTDYAVFLENVTAHELASILGRTGKVDRDRTPAGSKKSPEPRFDGPVVVKEMSSWDVRELTDLLGVDPTTNRPKPPARPAIDISKPLPTEDEVKAALDGKGVPRPGANNALVLPLSSSKSRSPELRRFLDGRQPLRPATVQVFLVLRNVGS
jgi:hypothetical protein